MKSIKTIDDYLAQFPPEIQHKLTALRQLIHLHAPGATEKISYQMPTFYQTTNLVHFAVHKHHIGFYPGPDAITAFGEELSGYKTSKGAIQFPLDQPLPLDLIGRIVRYRVETIQSKRKSK